MLDLKNEWERSQLLRPKDNIISHVHLKNPRIFRPSYEDDPVIMNWLLGMEYGRVWTKERNDFVKDRVKKTKPKFIENDYWNWIEKRKPKVYRQCKAEGVKNLINKGKR
ncbi:uncharacterized protein LOC106091580 [Stomoxys calcitrans]|uniref:uncharacterized protein LOC106091580 n=1 Tax=Stomoxys calcitrans TaxID=35570 RepID=UPI0027E36A3A|nr:uncharacterized protein LOC106091580 [Stomoxys calcitrans]